MHVDSTKPEVWSYGQRITGKSMKTSNSQVAKETNNRGNNKKI